MSMPLSIGDILLLSKIAYQIGVAFTSGRKSAPREFAEIENQLFALSTALEVLTQYVTKANGTSNPGALVTCDPSKPVDNGISPANLAKLQSMITNCKVTLEGLENVVKKYCKVMDPPPDPGPQGLLGKPGTSLPKRKWQKALKDNWSKVVWTTEGENLATLRDHLVSHITSISLIVNTMQSSKTDSIDEKLQQIYERLEAKTPLPELSNLTIQNFTVIPQMYHRAPPKTPQIEDIDETEQNKVVRRVTDITNTTAPMNPNPTALSRASTLPVPATKEVFSPNSPVFEVCIESEDEDLKVVCPEAYVCDQWAPRATSVAAGDSSVNKRRVFSCNCKSASTGLGYEISSRKELSVYDSKYKHKLDDIYFLPMSFATRMTGSERNWCIYPTGSQSSGTLRKLVIKGVKPTDLDEFERNFVDRLNLSAALDMIHRKKSTTFVYPLVDDPDNLRVALLDFMADDSQFKDSLKTVTFRGASGEQRTERIDYLQILNYKTLPLSDLTQDTKVKRDQFEYSEPAKLAIHFQQTDEIEDQRSIYIYLDPDTVVERIPKHPRRLLIKDVMGDTSEGRDITGDIIIRMKDVAALENLYETLEEVIEELQIQIIKGPTWAEQIIFQMYAGDIRIADKFITDAEILITRDASVDPEKHRLLIRSPNGSSYFCKEIPGPADFPPILSRLFVGYAVFVEMTDPTIITEFKKGLAGEGGPHFITAAFEYVFTTELENLAGRFSNQDLTASGHLLTVPPEIEI